VLQWESLQLQRERHLQSFNLLDSRRGRFIAFGTLYISEGIPYGFSATAMVMFMRMEGLSIEQIGAFAAAVDAAHLRGCVVHHVLGLGGVGTVGPEETGLRAEAGGGGRATLQVAPGDANGCACLDEDAGAGEADAGRAAGDQNALAGQAA
jgi:hypothetical protein